MNAIILPATAGQIKTLLASGHYRHACLYDYDRYKVIHRLQRDPHPISITAKEPGQ